MGQIALPTRTGPKNGTFAFTEEGEEQIHDAVTLHGLSKIRVAADTGSSIVTVDAIIRRVKARRQQQVERAPEPCTSEG